MNGRGENDLWQSFSFFAVLAAGGLGEDDPDAIDAAAARFGTRDSRPTSAWRAVLQQGTRLRQRVGRTEHLKNNARWSRKRLHRHGRSQTAAWRLSAGTVGCGHPPEGHRASSKPRGRRQVVPPAEKLRASCPAVRGMGSVPRRGAGSEVQGRVNIVRVKAATLVRVGTTPLGLVPLCPSLRASPRFSSG